MLSSTIFIWSRVPVSENQPPSRRYHSGVYYGNCLFIFGGIGSNQLPKNDMYSLDNIKWNQIEMTGDVPSPRYGHVAIMYDGKWYIHGGNEAKYAALGDFYVYDFEFRVWTKLNVENVPSPRYFHSAVVHNNKIYMFGGCKTNKIYYNDLYVYDFVDKAWTLLDVDKATLPLPRAGHTSFVLNNKLYIYGGFGDDGGYTYRYDMFYLDFENPERWVPVAIEGVLPATGRPLTNVVLDNRCYIFGGYDKTPQGKLYCFNPDVNFWSTIDLAYEIPNTMNTAHLASSKWLEPTPRYGHCNVVDNNQSILLFGGSGSMFLSEVLKIEREGM